MGNNESSGGGTGLRIKEKEVEILGGTNTLITQPSSSY